MLSAATGFSDLPDPLAAGEAAALDALTACEDARYLLVFAGRAHADRLDVVAQGARGLAGGDLVTACAGHAAAVADGAGVRLPGVAALAIGGWDLLLRPAQSRSGAVDGGALARELGAPRDGLAIVLLPGPEAGPIALIAQALSAYSGPPVVVAPGAIVAAADVPYTAHMAVAVDRGGTLAWLLAGKLSCATAVGPAFTAGPGPWTFGLYLGAAGGDSAADLAAIRTSVPGVPVAGLVGTPSVADASPAGRLLLVGRAAGPPIDADSPA